MAKKGPAIKKCGFLTGMEYLHEIGRAFSHNNVRPQGTPDSLHQVPQVGMVPPKPAVLILHLHGAIERLL